MVAIHDLEEANRCIRELTALSLLPAIWGGGKAGRIRESLADALQNSLRPDIVYVATGISDDKSDQAREMVSFKRRLPPTDVAQNLKELLKTTISQRDTDTSAFHFQGETFQLAVRPLGPNQEFGFIAVASSRPDFPNSTERILLDFCLNQAILAFRSAQHVAALGRSESDLRLALEGAELGAWEYRFDKGTVLWDERCRNLWGLTKESQLDFESVMDQIHPQYRARIRKAVDEALAGNDKGKYLQEFPVIWPDGSEHWIVSHGQVYFDGEGKKHQPVRFVGVVREITAQKRATEFLEETVHERTARLKETISELEAFSYSISHDMRSPLRAMQGYAEALLEKYRSLLDEKGAHYLTRIHRSAVRLDLLIQDVLAYSKIAKDDIQLEVLDLEGVIRDAIEDYPQLQPHKENILIAAPLPKVVGHGAYMTQIVSNLLGNAVKFVPPETPPRVRVWAENGGPDVRLWVEDNGIGIAPRHHHEIFQIFGRVYPEKKYQGTGIGLAIVRKAAERMGGSVGLESELGKGSRFWVNLKSAL